ncbi:hypothetical protein EVAR_42891_1 [Eumeta japonica]|uniref:Uncharacterized protein n=1 Tax=Eumeta variegata TaxID=151549 RepID=A0A4C1YHM2_EUMVA|nr:hypothetical protein EVAR_42891_1 [Eumeta japonica]
MDYTFGTGTDFPLAQCESKGDSCNPPLTCACIQVEWRSVQFVSMVSYLVAMLTQLYVSCWCGHELSTASEALPTALYEAAAGGCASAERLRRAVLFAMMRMQRPLVFRLGHYVPLCRQTFVTVRTMQSLSPTSKAQRAISTLTAGVLTARRCRQRASPRHDTRASVAPSADEIIVLRMSAALTRARNVQNASIFIMR